MVSTAIFISEEIKDCLPLYCRNLSLAAQRITAVLTHLGADVVHVKTYALHETMECLPVEIVVLVTKTAPVRLMHGQDVRYIFINFESKLTLHTALRSRHLESLRKLFRTRELVNCADAAREYAKFKEPMPFETAFAIAERQGYLISA